MENFRLWHHKWSKLPDQYRAQWLTWSQSKWKLLSLMVFGKNYGSLCCLWLLSGRRKTKCISSNKFQADNQRRKQAVTTNDLSWGLRRQRPLQTSSFKAKKWCTPTISFLVLTKIKVRLRQIERPAVFRVTFHCTEAELKLTHMA